MIDLDRLRRHVETLARVPRPAGSRELLRVRQYVTAELQQAGWSVRPVPFTAVSPWGEMLEGVNLVAEHPRCPLAGRPQVCLGAHLDSTPESPGADDNASAVAALLEIARLLPAETADGPRWGLELVVFDLEECGMLGGAAHAAQMRQAGIELRGMVSLEMLGYCDPTPGSQALPRGLGGLYPDTGDFIGIVGNQNSQWLIDLFREGMQRVPGLPVEWIAVPGNGEPLQATRLSDHSPFWDAGYSALMITDTSFLRNPHYHQSSDLPETLDYDFLTRVAEGCLRGVERVLEGLPG
ncbi:MAG: M28 family peptidase [Planctomycetaceae bacterium]